MKEYRITNSNHNAIIRIKAESANKASNILQDLLESVQIPTLTTEGWEIKLIN